MAYKKDVIELARRFYVVEGKTIEEISRVMNLPNRTVWNWKQKGLWDKELSDSGFVSMFLEMQKQFTEAIKDAIKDKKLADPATADALWKTAKLMDRLLPEKMLLANLFSFLEDMTNYFMNNETSPEFLDKFRQHLKPLSDCLRAKYTKD